MKSLFNSIRCTTTIAFCLASDFFINLKHLLYFTLVLLLTLWKVNVGRCHKNETQKSKSFFNYHANLTSVITMKLKLFFVKILLSLYGFISCDVFKVKHLHEFLRYVFYILATPLLLTIKSVFKKFKITIKVVLV